jgi:hypothetical protein
MKHFKLMPNRKVTHHTFHIRNHQDGLTQIIILGGLLLGFALLFWVTSIIQSNTTKPETTPTPKPTAITTSTPAPSYEPITLNFQLPKAPKDTTPFGRYEVGVVKYSPVASSPISYLMSKVLGNEVKVAKVLIYLVDKGQNETTINMIDTDSKDNIVLVSDGSNNISPVLIDDSRLLYLTRAKNSSNSNYQVKVLDLINRETKTVSGLSVNFPPYVSPNGKKVAFISDKNITILETSQLPLKNYPVNLSYFYYLNEGKGAKGASLSGIPQLAWVNENILIYSDKNTGNWEENNLFNDFYQLELERGKSTRLTDSSFVKRNPQVMGNQLVFTKHTERQNRWVKAVVDLANPSGERILTNTDYAVGEGLANPDRTKILTTSFNDNDLITTAVIYMTDVITGKQQDLFPDIKATNRLIINYFKSLTLLGWLSENELVFMTSGPEPTHGDYIYKYNLKTKQLTFLYTPPKPTSTPSAPPSSSINPSPSAVDNESE